MIEKPGFFGLTKINGHDYFITPDNQPFFSIGLNHFDSTILKSPDNVHVWRDKYGADIFRWIREGIRPDLTRWGFNTIGWVQEVVVISHELRRHNENWSVNHYQAAEMPYCHMIPFAETHQWNVNTLRPNVFLKGFEDWCDFAARRDCVDMAEDPNLIGYFYSDCPNWIHPSLAPDQVGPWFDPDMLQSEIGRKEFARAVDQYYKVTTRSIRRYDKNHLILGDRLEGNAPLPVEIVQIASRYVNVLSFQFFGSPDMVLPKLAGWNAVSGLPILLADASAPSRRHASDENITAEQEGAEYIEAMEKYFAAPFCVGWHYCGAYIRNDMRKNGLKDRFDKDRLPLTIAMAHINHRIIQSLVE